MDKYNSLFQTYLAMKSSLFTGNSLFKRSEYQYLTQHSKASLGNTIWEFPGDNKEGERLESKSWEEWRSAWELSGEKQERHDGVCSSRAIMYKRGKTLWAAPENRQGSANEAAFSSTQRKRSPGVSSLTTWVSVVTKYIPGAAHLLGTLATSLPQTNSLPLGQDDVSGCSGEKKKFHSQLLVGNVFSAWYPPQCILGLRSLRTSAVKQPAELDLMQRFSHFFHNEHFLPQYHIFQLEGEERKGGRIRLEVL